MSAEVIGWVDVQFALACQVVLWWWEGSKGLGRLLGPKAMQGSRQSTGGVVEGAFWGAVRF